MRKMGCGKWVVGSRMWDMESGKLKVEVGCGKWDVESGLFKEGYGKCE